jgi:FAD/FMN-containing dehydrogenase
MLLSGWGRYPRAECVVEKPSELAQININASKKLIARGMGRSYGDSSLQPLLTIDTSKLDKILNLDEAKGTISVQAGMTIVELIKTIVPKGWFLPVTPGTKFVTIGGMVASDVHGKNHHIDGSFGNHVISFKIIDAAGQEVFCSPKENPSIFWATIGGMGLTGIITSVSFNLIPIETSYIKQEVKVATSLDSAMKQLAECHSSTYSVAWIDCLAKGAKKGRSIIYTGEHIKSDDLPAAQRQTPFVKIKKSWLKIPFPFPTWILNNFSIRVFNSVYYFLNTIKKPSQTTIDKFFYPLDGLHNWNLIYGKNGFIQYQIVLPVEKSSKGLNEIIDKLAEFKSAPFLAVLKLMGEKNEGYLSFPRKGFTLAMDIPYNKNNLKLLENLDEIVLKYSGQIYLTKDSRLSAEMFRKTQPNLKKFTQLREKNDLNKFSSMQSERLGL